MGGGGQNFDGSKMRKLWFLQFLKKNKPSIITLPKEAKEQKESNWVFSSNSV